MEIEEKPVCVIRVNETDHATLHASNHATEAWHQARHHQAKLLRACLRHLLLPHLENLSPTAQEARQDRENGSESKPPSTEPPASSPPFQREPPRTPEKPQWNYPPPPVDIM
ncbi:Uncharacterized protein OBRU01_18624, partial [Operophtera brumata]